MKSILPLTTKRVQLNTKEEINNEIKGKTIRNLNDYKKADEETIGYRINRLNKEWDTERLLEANAAALVLMGSVFGVKNSKACLLTGTVSLFLLQHALQGWCPPVPVIRRFGVRTSDEINTEKIALKMMRGDFAANTQSVDEIFKRAKK